MCGISYAVPIPGLRPSPGYATPLGFGKGATLDTRASPFAKRYHPVGVRQEGDLNAMSEFENR